MDAARAMHATFAAILRGRHSELKSVCLSYKTMDITHHEVAVIMIMMMMMIIIIMRMLLVVVMVATVSRASRKCFAASCNV